MYINIYITLNDEGGGPIKYNYNVNKIRKKAQKQIITNRTFNQTKLFTQKQNRKKPFFIIMSIILVFMLMIVVIPTIVVNIDAQKEVHKSVTPNEEPVFQEVGGNDISIEVSIQREATGAVETVPLEEYVKSVVASEMPADFADEALKAQAIAARTYIINHLMHDNDRLISDTTTHQVYRNKEELKTIWGSDFEWKWNKISRAVNDTKAMIITYDNKPITPTFFSMSNGFTEDAKYYWGNEFPYLKSVESKWEESLPNFMTQEIFSTKEVKEKLNITYEGKPIPINITRTPSNRVSEITIGGQTFSGREVREKLNLRSTDFSIEQKNDHLVVTTRGYGHGVGMSQYGANGMAEEGKTFEEILAYYYNGIELTVMSEEATPHLIAINK